MRATGITPLCLVAHEIAAGRTVRLWQDEFGPFPPYRLDPEALFVSYACAAEFGVHLALGWGEPACALDSYVEFRHCVNNGAVKSEDREKGFFSLLGALRYFCDDALDLSNKDEMRDRILQGPPFTARNVRTFCTTAKPTCARSARLLPHIVPTIRSLPHAMLRAKFQWAMRQSGTARCAGRSAVAHRYQSHWAGMQLDLVRSSIDRSASTKSTTACRTGARSGFRAFVKRNDMSWPQYEDGALDETDQTFRAMAGLYPFIEPLRELRYSLSKLRLNDLAVGSDGRNRTPLWAYRHQDRAQCAVNRQVHFWAGQVD